MNKIKIVGNADKKFYVYELWNPIKNLPFYVGKGKNSRYMDHIKEAYKRSTNKHLNKHKINTIKQIILAGKVITIKIVFTTNDLDAAKTAEIQLIKKYGRADKKTGILTNMTDGGDGCHGYIITRKTRMLQSKNSLGNRNNMFNKKHKIKSKKLISKTRKHRFKSGQILPTKHSMKWKQQLKDHNPNMKKVDDDIIIKLNKEGKNITDISRITGITKRIIENRIRKYNLPTNVKSVIKLDITKIDKLINTGYSYKEISDIMNTSESTVSKTYRDSKYYTGKRYRRLYKKEKLNVSSL